MLYYRSLVSLVSYPKALLYDVNLLKNKKIGLYIHLGDIYGQVLQHLGRSTNK